MSKANPNPLWRRASIALLGSMAVLLVLVVIPGYLVWLLVNLYLGESNFSADRVTSACTLVMQIDSFLAAGYIVAIFQLQGDVARKIEQGMTVRQRLRTSPDDKTLPFALRAPGGFKYFATRRFPIAMLPLALFAFSGIATVYGVLFVARYYVALSITALVMGALIMIFRWYRIVSDSEEIAEFIGKHSVTQ